MTNPIQHAIAHGYKVKILGQSYTPQDAMPLIRAGVSRMSFSILGRDVGGATIENGAWVIRMGRQWEEHKHPRARDGKFARKGQGEARGGGSKPKKWKRNKEGYKAMQDESLRLFPGADDDEARDAWLMDQEYDDDIIEHEDGRISVDFDLEESESRPVDDEELSVRGYDDDELEAKFPKGTKIPKGRKKSDEEIQAQVDHITKTAPGSSIRDWTIPDIEGIIADGHYGDLEQYYKGWGEGDLIKYARMLARGERNKKKASSNWTKRTKSKSRGGSKLENQRGGGSKPKKGGSRFEAFDTIPGKVLTNRNATGPGSKSERKHLVKMDSGEFALVSSWESNTGFLGAKERVYSIENRIGSHPTMEEALARFDKWVGPGKKPLRGGPES